MSRPVSCPHPAIQLSPSPPRRLPKKNQKLHIRVGDLADHFGDEGFARGVEPSEPPRKAWALSRADSRDDTDTKYKTGLELLDATPDFQWRSSGSRWQRSPRRPLACSMVRAALGSARLNWEVENAILSVYEASARDRSDPASRACSYWPDRCPGFEPANPKGSARWR